MAQHRSPGARDLVITCIKGEGSFLKFWALPLAALETVKSFESHFLGKANELESCHGFLRSEDIPVGSKCAVKSNIKQSWCRSRVIGHKDFSSIVVQLMDYGNEEVISVANVRHVNDHIFAIPPQAVECILADVMPTRGNEWLPEAIKFCEGHLLYKTLSCYVVSDYMKLPVVRVAIKGENQAFVQRLINSGLAYIKQESVSSPPVLSYKMNNMDQNTVHLVKVTFVESIHKFYVQLSAVEVELKNLMDSLNSLPRENFSFLKLPKVNTPCLAQLSLVQKPCFYRARIVHVEQNRYNVFFVDYGFSEMKDVQELRAIPPEFLNLPAQAICCSLPRDATIDSGEFRCRTSAGHFECHVLNRTAESYIVKLLYRGQDLLPSSLTYTQQKLNVGSSCDVTVSYVNDLTEFFCQLTHFKDQQVAISSILNSEYKFIPIPLSECTPNKPVCVKFSEDGMWYRAKIIKVDNERSIEVFFVDFGNCDTVNLCDVRKISPDLIKFPVQAFRCYLFETLLPSESKAKDAAFDLFEELTAEVCLVAQVKAFTEESGYGIVLHEKNSALSINEKLQSAAISITTIPFDDIENVYVTSFEHPNLFFVQFEKLDSDSLTQMQEEINSFYSGHQNISFIPEEESLVCARFKDDDQFYRARVEKLKDGFCNVFFIDYGNRESIPVKDIHPINLNFTKYPQFGCECAFENCPSGVPNDKLSGLMLENSIQLRRIKEENGKYFVALTENFSGNVDILELFKHENKIPRSIHGAGLGGFQEKSLRRDDSQVSQTNSWHNESTSRNNNNNDSRRLYNKAEQQKEIVPRSVTPPKVESLEELKDFEFISIPPKACRNVYVSHVISPSEFYCQIEEDNAKLLLLMKSIEDIYSTFDNNKLNFVKFIINAPCCAEFQEDGTWYRGKIKNIHSNSCDIFFVDYGNTDSVPMSKIKKLTNELARFPSQAVCCKSFNISPSGKEWNKSEIDAFIKMTLDKSFVAQFVECDSNGIYAVNLVSIGKLEEDIFNKEFVNLGYGRLQDATKSLVLNSHAASSNLSFSTIDVETSSSAAVQVFYGLNPGEIFCQLKSNEKEFMQMMTDLQDYYNNISDTEALIDRPHQGMICVAKFLLDSAWYRAEIKKIEMSKIIVLYVDYGNIETVDRKNIRFILQDYTILPVQALKCRIRGIKPPGKSWTVTSNLSKYFEGNTVCKFLSKQKDCYIVDMTCDQKDVAQLLISDKIAVPDEVECAPKVQLPETKSSIPQPKLPDRKDAFVIGQLVSVTVSYVESPSKFWCQLLDDSETLLQIMADIEEQYKGSEISSIDSASVKVGSYCIAQYFEDEAWYRAQIQSCQGNTFKVFFVDYGNSEEVSVSQMKAMLPQFMELPPQCFECCLENSPPNPTPEMTTLFNATIEEAEEITAKFEKIGSHACTVSLLYDKDDDEVNISELLFGIKDGSESAVPGEAPQFLPPDVPLGPHEGYVSAVNTPQDFYIQLSGTEDTLDEISTELADTCETSEGNFTNLCIGYACAAKYSEDNNWYRAEITCIHDSTVDVLFVDYGNVDTVEKNSVKNLSDKLLQIPPMAIKCKLNGIIPVAEEWSDEAVKTFQEMVLESCLGITFISKDIPAAVNIAKEDKEITQCLVDMELANVETCTETDEAYAEDHLAAPIEDPLSSLPNDQSYPKRKLSSTKLLVKICYVDSYDKFYVMPLELSTELDTVMTTLGILYSADKEESNDSNSTVPEILEDPKSSMPCVAKYSEDDAWYRAVITDVDGDNIYVTFVDYGNSEITTLANLRSITPELVKIPPIAMECSLYGIEAVSGQEQGITVKLEEYFVEEVELEMEICEYSPYKIKLNHDGDIASMFIKEGMAKEKVITPVESETIEAYVGNSKMTFVDESLEYRIQISKRFFTGVDKIVGNVKFCELENDLIAFYVVSTDLEDELHNLQQKLQDAYYEAPNNLSNVACMDFCAAKYMEDENWYRAQVLSCDKEKVKVRFIDYGNCETVDRSDIYELLSDFSIEPQFSVKCIPFGLKVNKSKEVELQNRLDEYVYHEPVELKLCKYSHAVCDPCVTDVICGDTDISEMILNEKLVSQQYICNNQLSGQFKAKVENVVDNKVYVLPLELEEEREAFVCKLQEICNGINNESFEITDDYLYAAKIKEIWYRVSVINISGSNVAVFLVDFGTSEEVNVSDLILIPDDISHQPLFLQTCTVEKLQDSSCSDQEKKLQNLHAKCTVLCEVQKSYIVTSALLVKILEIEASKDVNIVEGDEIAEVKEVEENIAVGKDTKVVEIEENIVSKDGIDDTEIGKNNVIEDDVADLMESVVETVKSGNMNDVIDDTDVTENAVIDNFVEEANSDEISISCKDTMDILDGKENITVNEDFSEDILASSEKKEAESHTTVDDTYELDNDFVEVNTGESTLSNEHTVDVLEVKENIAVNEDFSEDILASSEKKESEFHTVVDNTCDLDNKDEELQHKENCFLEENIDSNDNLTNIEVNNSTTKYESINSGVVYVKDMTEDNNVLSESESTTSKTEIFESDDSCSKDISEDGINVLSESEAGVCKAEMFEPENDIHQKEAPKDSVNVLSKHENFNTPEQDNLEYTPTENVLEVLQYGQYSNKSQSPCVYNEEDKSDFDETEENFADSSSEIIQNVNKDSKVNEDDADITSIVESINMNEIQIDFEEIEDNDQTCPNATDISLNMQIHNEAHDTAVKSANAHGTQNDGEQNEDLKSCSTVKDDLDTPVKSADAHETQNNEDMKSNADDLEVILHTEQHDSQIKDCEKNLETSSNNLDKESSKRIQESLHLSGSVEVKISDINISDGSIILAVQPVYLQQEFSLLKDSIHNKCPSENLPYYDSSESNFCAVYHENEWCRGKVLQNGEDQWLVLLIDYGEVVTVENSQVKSLDFEYYNKPPFAVWCTLAGAVCSSEKSETVKEFLCDLVKGKNAIIKILEGDEPFKVNLYVGDSNILNHLLENNLVTQKLPNIHLEPGSYKAKLLFSNMNSEKFDMFVCLSSFFGDYITLTESIQTMYKIEDTVPRITESSIYAVFHNNVWCRGLILDCSDVTRIYLVDYGETITDYTSLCYLLPEHSLQPAYALPCHTPFLNVPDKVSDCVKKVLEEEFLVQVYANAMGVTLTDEHVLNELKSLGLEINHFSEPKSDTDETEFKLEAKNLVTSSDEFSKTVQEQESSEQIVGYLEETFTAHPL